MRSQDVALHALVANRKADLLRYEYARVAASGPQTRPRWSFSRGGRLLVLGDLAGDDQAAPTGSTTSHLWDP